MCIHRQGLFFVVWDYSRFKDFSAYGCSTNIFHVLLFRYPKRSRTANNNSADNSDEDVNDDAAVSARGGAGTEGNSCVGEVIDSDSSSRKSEVRLVFMMKMFGC